MNDSTAEILSRYVPAHETHRVRVTYYVGRGLVPRRITLEINGPSRWRWDDFEREAMDRAIELVPDGSEVYSATVLYPQRSGEKDGD